MGAHHDEALATAALQMAVAVRGGHVTGVVFHTDQGSEYTAAGFRAACTRVGVTQSMGRTGSALDNAPAESWNSTLELELLRTGPFATREQARAAVAAWIDDYNTERLHSGVEMFPPVEYEQRTAAARNNNKEAA
jgi:transposase InsO family protein